MARNAATRPRKRAKSGPYFTAVRPITPAQASYYELLNDLSNFIGIGTLRFQMPRRAAAGMEAPDGWLWLEDHQFPKGYHPDDVAKKTRELLLGGVVRLTYRMVGPADARVRVYVLPEDVGRSLVPVNSATANTNLRKVISAIDTSEAGWKGGAVGEPAPLLGHDDETTSLFYLFNTIKSPAPNPDAQSVSQQHPRVRERLRHVLGLDPFPDCGEGAFRGLRTTPFQYQRQSIAMMLQREMAPEPCIDSRLKEMVTPSGESTYYVDLDSLKIYKKAFFYDDVRGGILAEEMGTGKTLMCIGAIAATKGEYAAPPNEQPVIVPEPDPPGLSLLNSCVGVIWKEGIWRPDNMPEHFQKSLAARHAYYEVPAPTRSRSRRQTQISALKKKVFLGKGTIVVCPPNLVGQWRSEITKHVQPGFLKVAVLDHHNSVVPELPELLDYDVLLFSRSRFDREYREGMDEKGRRAAHGAARTCQCPYIGSSRTPDCHCFKAGAVYRSPLMSVRWKRMIVDEGHFLGSGGKTRGLSVTERLSVERMWIVSGTPSDNLLGVTAGVTIEGETPEEKRAREQNMLEERKAFQESEAKDLDRLGHMVRDFLRLRPWAPCGDRADQASWNTYITKGFLKHRVGSTQCVQNILQRLVVRHTAEDIEKSHQLPPLYHTIIRLKPGFYEKLSMNLFVMALTVNAVTSEREDEDYMFHPKNRGDLRVLINNLLKESGFFWTGTEKSDVESTIKIARQYLEERNGVSRVSEADRGLLQLAIRAGRQAIDNLTWNGLSLYHEMGYFVSGLPTQTIERWAITHMDPNAPLLGGCQLLEIQKFVHKDGFMFADNPSDIFPALEERGDQFMPGYRERTVQGNENLKRKYKLSRLETRKGIAASAISSQSSANRSPTKGRPKRQESLPDKHKIGISNKTKKAPQQSKVTELSASPAITDLRSQPERPKTLRSALKKNEVRPPLIPASLTLQAKIIGTTSTKLSYLLSAVQRYHETEKILVFYETDNVAAYISQGLDALGIEWLAMQRNLPGATKAKYIVAFHHLPRFRVLLLDLSQAAHGLNICSASRVYFVNSVWTPSIEAQALKRAHRIGQTKPVYVETLVLEGTLEDEMVKRRQAMSDSEISKTQDNVINDHKMRDIISNLQFYEVTEDEGVGMRQVAPLEKPEPVFGDTKMGGPVLDEGAFLVELDDVGEDEETKSPQRRAEKEESTSDYGLESEPTLSVSTPSTASNSEPMSLDASVQQVPSGGPRTSVFGGEVPATLVSGKRSVTLMESPTEAPPSKSVRFA